jgi:hypothetical protein
VVRWQNMIILICIVRKNAFFDPELVSQPLLPTHPKAYLQSIMQEKTEDAL